MTLKSESAVVRQPTHILAILSLVLSILGLFPPILPLLGSVAGLVTGTIARREIKLHPEWYKGDGFAQAGVILAWIGIGMCVLALVFGILFLLTSSGTSQAFHRL